MREGWEIKKLGEFCQITMGQSPASSSYNTDKMGLPFFQGCADFGIIHPNITTYCNAPTKIGQKKDILMSVRAPIGTLNIANQECCIGRGLASIREIKGLSQYKYVYYFLKHSKDDLISKGTGATFKAITKEVLANYPISAPSILEQQKIVEELDCLSNMIELKKKQLETYDKLAQSIFYDMFGDPIINEKGWEIKKIGEIGTIITGNTPSTKNKDNYSSNDYCFVKPSDICKDSISYIENTEYYISSEAYQRTRQLPKGSVLITCIGIIGKIAIVKQDCTCNQQINAVLPNTKYVNQYLAWALLMYGDNLREIANAPVVPLLNKTDFSLIEVPLPPLTLQQQFAEKIEEIEKQKDLIKQTLKSLEELFNSRMDYYFN